MKTCWVDGTKRLRLGSHLVWLRMAYTFLRASWRPGNDPARILLLIALHQRTQIFFNRYFLAYSCLVLSLHIVLLESFFWGPALELLSKEGKICCRLLLVLLEILLSEWWKLLNLQQLELQNLRVVNRHGHTWRHGLTYAKLNNLAKTLDHPKTTFFVCMLVVSLPAFGISFLSQLAEYCESNIILINPKTAHNTSILSGKTGGATATKKPCKTRKFLSLQNNLVRLLY